MYLGIKNNKKFIINFNLFYKNLIKFKNKNKIKK